MTLPTQMRPDPSFSAFAHSVLSEVQLPQLLQASDAVVLERIAMGAGRTEWYYCTRDRLQDLEASLSPGSVVSFYFDERVTRATYSAHTRARILEIVARTSDAVVGTLSPDQLHIDTEIIAASTDLADFESELRPGALVYFGAFPGRDNDGVHAVTITLPDRDGVVRPHPH